jgi:hypothetical protein
MIFPSLVLASLGFQGYCPASFTPLLRLSLVLTPFFPSQSPVRPPAPKGRFTALRLPPPAARRPADTPPRALPCRASSRQLFLSLEDQVVMIDEASGGGGKDGRVKWADFLVIMNHSCWY